MPPWPSLAAPRKKKPPPLKLLPLKLPLRLLKLLRLSKPPRLLTPLLRLLTLPLLRPLKLLLRLLPSNQTPLRSDAKGVLRHPFFIDSFDLQKPPQQTGMPMTLCPCGSSQPANACCSPILERTQTAPTAEALMRARYCAYVAKDVDFVMETTLPASRSDSDIKAMKAWAEQSEWEGLEVIASSKGSSSDLEGEVEFIARYRMQGVAQQHHEKSFFVKEEGKWYFKDGEVLASGPTEKATPVVNANKTGRNDPCPCGSGKKFKKCCGA